MAALTAFRLFGEFVWPPMPDEWFKHHAPNKDLAAGVVEILAVEDAKKKLVYCLRWLPKEELSKKGEIFLVSAPFTEDLAKLKKVFDLKQDDLGSKLAEPSAPYAFRIDAPNSKKKTRLQFRGAFLIDQFRLDETSIFDPDGAEPKPDFRLPLVRSHAEGKDRFTSELLIGQPGNPNFRFNLIMTLPAPHRDQQTGAYCAFSTVHPPTPTRGELPRCVTAVFGRPDHDATGTAPKDSFNLGHFGFCKELEDDEAPFSAVDKDVLWHTSAILASVLQKLGFDADLSDDSKLEISDNYEEIQNIRFKLPDKSEKAVEGLYAGSIFQRIGIRLDRLADQPTLLLGTELKLTKGLFEIALSRGGVEWLSLGDRFYVDFELG